MTKHIQAEIILTPPPPFPDSSYFSHSLPAPFNLHAHNMPFKKKREKKPHSDMD